VYVLAKKGSRKGGTQNLESQEEVYYLLDFRESVKVESVQVLGPKVKKAGQ